MENNQNNEEKVLFYQYEHFHAIFAFPHYSMVK